MECIGQFGTVWYNKQHKTYKTYQKTREYKYPCETSKSKQELKPKQDIKKSTVKEQKIRNKKKELKKKS